MPNPPLPCTVSINFTEHRDPVKPKNHYLRAIVEGTPAGDGLSAIESERYDKSNTEQFRDFLENFFTALTFHISTRLFPEDTMTFAMVDGEWVPVGFAGDFRTPKP